MGVFDKEEYIDRLIKAYITYPISQVDVPQEKRSDKCIVFREDLENLINKYKEQENTIDLMAKTLLDYANLGVLIKCPAEYDGKYFYKNCKIDVTKERTNKTNYLCKECVKEYFKKKAKGE